MTQTIQQYDRIIDQCRELFEKKTIDYGTAWRILRPSSLTDQIYIKAARIRSIQEKGMAKVNEPISDEFVGIINYSIMALIQLEHTDVSEIEIGIEKALLWYDEYAQKTRALMLAKNHDYGEAWRDMRISSMTDLILMKLLRVKSIEENDGTTIVSEGLDANYMDIMNYAIFALILIDEQSN